MKFPIDKKARFWGKKFHFQSFETSRNIEMNFSIKLNNGSEQLLTLSKLYHFFAKNSTHYKTSLKHLVALPLHQAYGTYSFKFYCSNLRQSEL